MLSFFFACHVVKKEEGGSESILQKSLLGRVQNLLLWLYFLSCSCVRMKEG